MTSAAQTPSEVTPSPAEMALYPVRGVSVTVRAELMAQLEATVAFADHCVFLTAGARSAQAAQLAQDAQDLYDTTMDELRRHGTPT